jgi:tRNA(Ile)-lysidine synthase
MEHKDTEMRAAVFYSGGADSTLLLHKALENHSKDDIVVIYADFDCEKTNPAREDNLAFVMHQCGNLDLTLLVETIKPKESDGKGPEGNARKAFKELRDWAEREFDVVYLGHQKDDHIETVLIQLFRGAGAGTKGIPDYHKGKIYRPLLTMTREEVIAECNKLGLPYFTDPSNSDVTMTRAFWRNEIIPMLKKHYGEKGTYTRINMIAEKFGGM